MPDEFDDMLENALKKADAAIDEGPYKKAMRDLLSKSMADIKAAIPSASYSDYTRLLTVIEHASAENLSQAALKDNIMALGATAMKIAKMIPSIAAILA